MSQLRLQMDNAMLVRGMAERTREAYPVFRYWTDSANITP